MDKSNSEPLLLSKTNNNLENIRKAYANGAGFSMGEIIAKTEVQFDLETMMAAANDFIPDDLLIDSPNLEEAFTENYEEMNINLPSVYIPGKVFFTEKFDSCLTKSQQAACLNVLKQRQGVNETNKSDSKLQQNDVAIAIDLQAKIQKENSRFLEYVKDDWNKCQRRALNLKETLKNYAHSKWENDLQRVAKYPQFYKPLRVLTFANELLDSEVSVTHVENLRDSGTVPKFLKPCLEVKHKLKIASLPTFEESLKPNYKLAVSEDPTILELLKTNPIDVVISSSGLKLLMDDSKANSEWSIPIIVKQNSTVKDNVQRTTVYIDKPLPKRFPTPIDFNYYCKKQLIKTNFCRYPGISFGQIPTNDDHPDKFTKVNCDLPDGNWKPAIFHNASYRIWNMKPKEKHNELMKTKHCKKNINVLIRCKLDACELLDNEAIRPVVVVPKLEYQVEHGASVPTKKEIIDQWTSLFFRPFSSLYRIRMLSNDSEIINVQSICLQSLNVEANSLYNYKPYLRLDVLYQVFGDLTKLAPGNYVLRYCNSKGPFIHVYSECMDSASPSERLNLHHMYGKESCYYTIPSTVPWTPIDPTYILPVHNVFKRMPGLFRPLIVNTTKTEKKKSGKRNKCKRHIDEPKIE